VIQYLQNNVAVIEAALSQHVFLALVPVLIGIVVSLPIGYLAVRFGFLYHPLLNLSGILYAVPSIALIVLVPTIVGIRILSPLNIIIALSVYTVALLVRVVADGQPVEQRRALVGILRQEVERLELLQIMGGEMLVDHQRLREPLDRGADVPQLDGKRGVEGADRKGGMMLDHGAEPFGKGVRRVRARRRGRAAPAHAAAARDRRQSSRAPCLHRA